MIVSAFLATFLAVCALPFLCALVAHGAGLIREGLPSRVEAVRTALRKAIGRAFRAPAVGISKRALERALRAPSTGIGALSWALASYKARWALAVASAGLRRMVTAAKVAVAAEVIPARARARASLRRALTIMIGRAHRGALSGPVVDAVPGPGGTLALYGVDGVLLGTSLPVGRRRRVFVPSPRGEVIEA